MKSLVSTLLLIAGGSLFSATRLLAQQATLVTNFPPGQTMHAPANVGVMGSAQVVTTIVNNTSVDRHYTVYVTWISTTGTTPAFFYFDSPITVPANSFQSDTTDSHGPVVTGTAGMTGSFKVKAQVIEDGGVSNPENIISAETLWALDVARQNAEENQQ